MKKILAILLVIAMLLPMCFTTTAAGASNVEIKPFNISTSLQEGFDNIWPKVHFWSRENTEYVTEDSIKISAMNGVGGKTPQEVAENLKPVFDKYPDGMRYIRFTSFRAALFVLKEDTIFMDKGLKVIKEWFEEFIAHYHSIGGKIDGISVDIEYVDGNAYYITQAAKKDMMVYKNIVDNPNYKTRIRPALEERGFKFWPNVTDETPEIYSINSNSGAEYAESRSIWNIVVRNHLNQYVNEGVLEPLLKYYPDGLVFDYQSRDTYSWQKMPGDQGEVAKGGNHMVAGNVNYFNTYASRPGTGFWKEDGEAKYVKIPSYNEVCYEDNPFNMVKFETIFAKNLKASAPGGKITSIVSYYNYSKRAGSYGNKPYYSESFYHTALMDPDPLAGYIEENEVIASGNDVHATMEVVSKLLDELTRIVGAADRKYLELPYTWNDNFILTGMYAGGKNYFRLTPDNTEGLTKLEDFIVKDAKDLTFTYKGQTITFPGGKIIEDAKIPIVGTFGFWIETDKDVLPVVTYSENRYSEFPAMLETYESYEVGSDYDISTAFPVGCWELKKDKTGTAKIVADGNNKALALSGNYSLKLKDVVEKITAGDTYAKKQAWEIDVTVPADMAADAEIILLDVYADKSKQADGGFKIAGGKIYYDKAGEYVELAGVDASAGGKFTMKRELDFTKEGAFTCDYTVYGADGKILGEAKDVPVASKVKIPVGRVGMGVSKIAGKAVQLDNLKMYATGLGADFELYNAKTGIKYTDLETAKDSNTAYRLSWMNATAYEKVYSVVAAYYNGDKLVEEKVIEEIKMAPGTDFVSMGIVEVKDGQTVKLYARNDSKAEPEKGGDSDGNNSGATTEKGNDSALVIIVIAVAVVLLAGIAVAVVLLTKKPAKKSKKKSSKKGKKTAKKPVKKAPQKEEKPETKEETAE